MFAKLESFTQRGAVLKSLDLRTIQKIKVGFQLSLGSCVQIANESRFVILQPDLLELVRGLRIAVSSMVSIRNKENKKAGLQPKIVCWGSVFLNACALRICRRRRSSASS